MNYPSKCDTTVKNLLVIILLCGICLASTNSSGKYAGLIRNKDTVITVVASNTSVKARANADYVCDGTADEVQINAAIVAVAAAAGRTDGAVGCGGEVHLLAGTYTIAAPIVMLTRVDLIGQGNLQNVLIIGENNCGNGIYFKAWDSGGSSINVNERGQFRIANIRVQLSYTQSSTSWGIYIDNDDTEYLYDAIFDNIYCAAAKTGGMYVKMEWASHYDKCTFETGHSGDGPGFQSDSSSGCVFNGCYYAHNAGHGCNLNGAGSNNYFSGCGFQDNGDSGDASHGLYLSSGALHRTFIVNCAFTDNWGSGFYISAGTKALLTNCVAYKNNYAGTWAKAGFRIGGSAVTDCILMNCLSYDNDGATPSIPPDTNGSGFYIAGNNIRLIGCYSSGNYWGVVLETSTSQCQIDVRFDQTANSHVTEIRYLGGSQNSTGRQLQDVFIDVAALVIDGVHAAVTQTGSAQQITTAITNPAVPRNVTVTGDADAEGTVLIQGVTADGKVFDTTSSDESIVVSAGNTVQGNVPWAKITKITIPLDSSIPTAGEISIGWGDKLGLSNVIRATSDIYKITFNNAYDLLTDYTINATYGTILPDAAINANDDFIIYYKRF